MVHPKCVSCKGNTKRAKLLRCLHSVCVGCLEKHVTRLNGVRCPDCRELSPGTTTHPLLSLPDSYAVGASQPGTEQPTTVEYCDECYEDEAAVSKCAECKALLCEFHVSAHSRNRSTHKHRVETIGKAAGGERDADCEQKLVVQFCILHPSEKVQTFCMTCRVLLCEICVSGGHGHDSTHKLMAVQDAADMMRSRVEASVACKSGDEDGGTRSVVSEAIENVSKAIKDLHGDTEAVSEQVEQYFESVVKLVKTREAKVLDNLDRLRTAKLLPLEEQKLRLQKTQTAHQTVSSLLTSCTDVYDFVRMAGWLEEAADAANSTAKKDRKPCVVSKLVFSPGPDVNQVATSICNVGDVLDAADVDMARSRIHCASSAVVDEYLSIEVEAVDQSGKAVTPEIAAWTSLRVVVTSPDEKSVECLQGANGDWTRLVSHYLPAVTGKHQVAAKHGDTHMAGSPVEVMVLLPQLSFNPDRCHPGIQLSNNNRTASCKGGDYWRSVCGDRVYRSGRAVIRIRLDAMPSYPGREAPMISLCNSTDPQLQGHQQDSTIVSGWHGGSRSSGNNWRGTVSDQPWKAGDVIHLLLDCDRRTLTGRHERWFHMPKTETLTNVTGDLYLYVSMFSDGQQVTIL